MILFYSQALLKFSHKINFLFIWQKCYARVHNRCQYSDWKIPFFCCLNQHVIQAGFLVEFLASELANVEMNAKSFSIIINWPLCKKNKNKYSFEV